MDGDARALAELVDALIHAGAVLALWTAALAWAALTAGGLLVWAADTLRRRHGRERGDEEAAPFGGWEVLGSDGARHPWRPEDRRQKEEDR